MLGLLACSEAYEFGQLGTGLLGYLLGYLEWLRRS